MTHDLAHAVSSERADRALRYKSLRHRLRMTVPELATATGYSAGHVSRWCHAGRTAVPVPQRAVTVLEGALRARAQDDLAFLNVGETEEGYTEH